MKTPAALILILLSAVTLFVQAPWETSNPRTGIITGVIMNGMALILYFEVFFVRITWDSENIYTHSPWRRNRVIPLSAVHSWDGSCLMRWHRIHTRGHGTIRLSYWGRGTNKLLADLVATGRFRTVDS